MQLLKCLETVRKCPLDKARSMQNSADSRIIGDQSILHFPVIPSGSPEVKISSNHELVNELFSKVDK